MFTGLPDETSMKHSEEFISYKRQVTISNSWCLKVVQAESLCPGGDKYFDSR